MTVTGKSNEDGAVRPKCQSCPLPFQVIERVNESRITRDVEEDGDTSLFEFYEATEGDTLEQGWRNKLINLGRQPARDGLALGEVRRKS